MSGAVLCIVRSFSATFLDTPRGGRLRWQWYAVFYPLATPSRQRAQRKNASMRSGAVPTSVPRAFGVSDAEWHALVTWHPNLLLEGTRTDTDRVLRAFHPHLIQPLFRWQATTKLSLPHDHRGSLLLLGVTAMDENEQGLVFDWLSERKDRVQVVSTVTRPLFPLVERGAFRADLYYRLSVLRLVAAPAMPHARP